ncbi:MAG: hypothetical protein ABWZ40_01950 [Caulobacterales bacterium]
MNKPSPEALTDHRNAIAQVAEALIESYRQRRLPPGEIYGDIVEMSHDPAAPEFDGPWTRDRLLAHTSEELRVWSQLMPDFRYEDVTVKFRDHGFDVSLRLMGTPPHGEALDIKAILKNEVRSGKIVAVNAWLDPEQIPRLAALMGAS